MNAAVEALKRIHIELAQRHAETPGAGFKTVEAWAKDTHMSRPHVYRLLKEGAENGRVETRKFRILTGSRVIPITHYRMIDKKKK